MQPKISKFDSATEFLTAERCHIVEMWNSPGDPGVSIARARVEPGVTTAWHTLDGVDERYVIAWGRGRMEVGDLPAAEVTTGDTIFVPAGVRQRITNIGDEDLLFLCICTPQFTPSSYKPLE